MIILYNIGIQLYALGIRLAAIWNTKARLWVDGRRGLKNQLKHISEDGTFEGCIWFHCASLGEFEQARPVIEALKKQTDHRICITFFSPSGYEIRKDYDADLILYLPLDTRSNAKQFVTAIKPKAAVFVKYELWHHYLKLLKQSSIPVYLLSATFRKDHRYFKWYGGFFRKMLKRLDGIFVQDKQSHALLKSINISSHLSGDTRYDRVQALASVTKENSIAEEFTQGAFTIVAGSSWQEEESLLKAYHASNPDVKIIIAPHDIGSGHLNQIEHLFEGQIIRYSKYDKNFKGNVLLIDNIGLLSSLYGYGDLAFIGGGFSGKLHNILEPAAYGIPVCFGPKHSRFHEAEEMIAFGSGFEVESSESLIQLVQKVRSRDFNKNSEFVACNTGATHTFMKHLL